MTISAMPPPKGWPRLSSSLTYRDPVAAIDFVCRAFGFEVQLKVDGEGGTIVHSELTLGGGLIMIGGGHDKGRTWQKSPLDVGGANTQALCLFVDDCDAHCERARAAGATIVMEPKTTDYGEAYWTDRTYECTDPEGHHWWFMQRVK